jgi:hypothetical protein
MFWLYDHAVALKGMKIFREHQNYPRSPTRHNKGGSVWEQGRARIEDTIELVRPVRGCQNGIEFVALK